MDGISKSIFHCLAKIGSIIIMHARCITIFDTNLTLNMQESPLL